MKIDKGTSFTSVELQAMSWAMESVGALSRLQNMDFDASERSAYRERRYTIEGAFTLALLGNTGPLLALYRADEAIWPD